MRAVAAEKGLPVIDYEPLALQMPDQGGLFKADGMHVHPGVLVNVMLNVVLNEYVEHVARHDQVGLCRFSLLRHLHAGCCLTTACTMRFRKCCRLMNT